MKRVAFCLVALLLVSEGAYAASAIGNSALALASLVSEQSLHLLPDVGLEAGGEFKMDARDDDFVGIVGFVHGFPYGLTIQSAPRMTYFPGFPFAVAAVRRTGANLTGNNHFIRQPKSVGRLTGFAMLLAIKAGNKF